MRGPALSAIALSVLDVLDVLDSDLAEIVQDGWGRIAELHEAARRTCAVPGTSKTVKLAHHEIVWHEEPEIELSVDELSLPAIPVLAEAGLEVQAAVATIRAGRMVSLSCGSATMRLRIEVAAKEVLRLEEEIDLPGVVRFGKGIPLLTPTELLAASEPVPQRRVVDLTGSSATASQEEVANSGLRRRRRDRT